jgi:hypothetical protein
MPILLHNQECAANSRLLVTSSAAYVGNLPWCMWLCQHGLDHTCMRYASQQHCVSSFCEVLLAHYCVKSQNLHLLCSWVSFPSRFPCFRSRAHFWDTNFLSKTLWTYSSCPKTWIPPWETNLNTTITCHSVEEVSKGSRWLHNYTRPFKMADYVLR